MTVGVGDAAYESDNTINVEGVNFCAGLKMSAKTRQLTRELEVKNGKLAIDSGDAGEKRTKITHVIIMRIR